MKGFTLIELVVTLAIVSIVVIAGVPSFASMMQRSRVAAVSNEFISTVKMARSEAVKRGLPVSVCASADGETCSGDTDWQLGWVILDSAGELIHQRAALSNRYLFSANFSTVQFLDSGYQAAGAVVFDLVDAGCEPANPEARTITVDRIGHVDVVEAACPSL